MNDADEEDALINEVEALAALYGDEKISFRQRQQELPATITIRLNEALTRTNFSATLSAQLPQPYPACRPIAPTLRAEKLSAAQCALFVNEMLARQTSVPGEVCLFEYCEAMIAVLHDNLVSAPTPEASGSLPKQLRDFTIFHSEPLTDRKSVFQAHLALIEAPDDVDAVLQVLRGGSRKVDTATHNTLAYRVQGAHGVVQDCDDDGEKGAGKCILYVLQQLRAVGVLCVVSRWFGGVKLGPVRFRHISKVTRDVFEKNRGSVPVEEAERR